MGFLRLRDRICLGVGKGAGVVGVIGGRVVVSSVVEVEW